MKPPSGRAAWRPGSFFFWGKNKHRHDRLPEFERGLERRIVRDAQILAKPQQCAHANEVTPRPGPFSYNPRRFVKDKRIGFACRNNTLRRLSSARVP